VGGRRFGPDEGLRMIDRHKPIEAPVREDHVTQTREDKIRQDVADLHGLGYAQELFRSMGGFSNFAISFSIISILTGAVILYDYGLAWAGTAAVMIGWPLVTVFVLAIAASMAELASAYPTAGGLYYWASKMKNKKWGWWTAWLNLIGQFAIVAGIDYAAAGFLNATILDRLTGGVFNTTVLIPGVLNGQLVTMGVILAIQLALNIAGINLVALLNQVSVWWHIAIVAIVVVLIFVTGKPDQSGLHLFQIQPLDQGGSWNNNLGFVNLQYGAANTYPLILAFFFSLLLANWTYTGYDASAHVAEETVGARTASAWGVFLSVAVSAVVGYIFLVAPPASTTSAAASRSSRSSHTTWARSAICSRRGSPSRCGSAVLRPLPPLGGCSLRSAATMGSRVPAGSSA
jgi:amino acid transporter